MLERENIQGVIPRDPENNIESFHGLYEIMERSHERLTTNEWEFCTCPSCQQSFYQKAKTPVGSCNSIECAGRYEFLQQPRRRLNVSVEDITEAINSTFAESGFHTLQPVNIKNSNGSTIFIGNAGQIFDRQIFREESINPNPSLIYQPAIRLQSQDKVGTTDGFATSFVNVATEQLEANEAQHVEILDKWMDFLSGIGLYLGDFTLKPKLEKTTWGAKDGIETYTLKFNYKGLEIGVSNYTTIPQKTRPEISQSDTAFGLERILWAINKNSRYYEVVGPLTNALRNEDVLMDAYRTTTLMAASGVHPGTDEQGSKLRNIAHKYGTLDHDFKPDIVKYYYKWWSGFTQLPLEANHTAQILRAEADRMCNTQVKRILHDRGLSRSHSDKKTLSTDLFASGLSSNQIDALREELSNE